MIELDDDGDRWLFDEEFLTSRWQCAWGHSDPERRCPGIGDELAPERAEGCCSVGAELLDEDEAMLVAALAASINPARFERHEAASLVEERSGGQWHTSVVDGACVFLNRPGFAGGAGCALHLAALDDGESPIDYKPSICWQLPLKVERGDDGTRRLRRWQRDDWGPGGATMAWCCTEIDASAGGSGLAMDGAFDGPVPVYESLSDELTALLGPDLFALLAERLRRA